MRHEPIKITANVAAKVMIDASASVMFNMICITNSFLGLGRNGRSLERPIRSIQTALTVQMYAPYSLSALSAAVRALVRLL